MSDKKRLLQLIGIMTVVVWIASVVAIYQLYQVSLGQLQVRLADAARRQARFIESVAAYDLAHDAHHNPQGVRLRTLEQIYQGFTTYKSLSQTEVVNLAYLAQDQVVYLIYQGQVVRDSKPMPVNELQGVPMLRALQGHSGTLVGLDSRGVQVVAAFEPVAELNMGLVIKVDLAEVRQPFLRAGLVAIAMAMLFVLLGALVFQAITRQWVRDTQENEGLLRTVLATAADAFIIIDQRGIIRSFNQAAERLFGYTAQQVLGKNVSLLMPMPHRRDHDDYLARYLQTGQRHIIGIGRQVEGQRKDGSLVPLELSVGEARVGDDVWFTGILKDITQRSQDEAALRHNRVLLTESQRMAHVGSWEWDILGNRITWSDETYRIFGLSPQSITITYDMFMNGVHPEDRSRVQQAIDQALTHPESYFVAHRVLRPNGELRWVEEQGEMERDAADQPLRMLGTVMDITERKLADIRLREANAALRQSERITQSILNTIPVRVFWKDREGVFLGMNTLVAQDLGQTYPEDLVGRKDADFLPPDVVARYRADDLEVMQHRTPKLNIEETQPRPDGSLAWLETSKVPLLNEQGEVIGILGVYHEITQRKQAEQALQYSRESLLNAQRIAHLGSWEWDMASNRVTWTDESYRIFGYPVQGFEANYDSFLNAVHPEDRERVKQAVTQAVETKGPYFIVHRVLRPNGELRMVEEQGEVYCDAHGHPQRMVGTVHDITERHQAEELARRVIEGSPLPHAVVEVSGVCRFVNRKYTEVLGYAPQDVSTMDDWWRQAFPIAAQREVAMANWQAWVQQAHTTMGVMAPQEIRVTCKDGTLKDMLLHYAPITQDLGVVVMSDITEQKLAAARLQAAMREAQLATQAKSEFLANMSHEIRTPMNGIIGMTQLALQTPLNDQQRDYLDKVYSSARSLLRVLNDILDFSKIEARKMDLEAQAFDLNEVFQGLSKQVLVAAQEKGLEVLYDIKPPVPQRVVGDALRLQQVLVNLVSNAIKFTEHGEVVVGVRLQSAQGEDLVLHFDVQDKGMGMTPEQTQKLFSSFSQGDSSIKRRFGGTGLGLAISKNLVQLMGGEIGVESQPGQGTTFFFTVQFKLTKELPPIPELAAGLMGRRVLVVDDSPSAQEILYQYLRQLGMKPQVAGRGPEALEMLRQAQAQGDGFALVLVDWQMPDMDGLTLVNAMQQDTALQGLPVIVLTQAHPPVAWITQARALGVAEFLAKPFTLSDVWNALHMGMARGADVARIKTTLPAIPPVLRGARILVVEDNAINMVVAQRLLTALGMQVIEAVDGFKALEVLAQQPVDAVLMDVHMPGMDGYETTAKIRAQPAWANLPIMALTANALKGERERCLAAGMNDYAVKPIDPPDVVAKLARLLAPTDQAPPGAINREQLRGVMLQLEQALLQSDPVRVKQTLSDMRLMPLAPEMSVRLRQVDQHAARYRFPEALLLVRQWLAELAA